MARFRTWVVCVALVTAACMETSASAQNVSQRQNSDFENIGSRNINKGFNPFSGTVDEEIRIGIQASKEFEQSARLFEQPEVSAHVDRVAQLLARNSDAVIPIVAKIIESEEINSFALPGGTIYVTTGLIRTAGDEAELAAGLAHAIARVAARHSMESKGKGQLVSLSSIPISIFTSGITSMIVAQATTIGGPTAFLKFSQADVLEADFLGLQYLYKAGYDPEAAIGILQKLEARTKASGRGTSALFQTHPPLADRIKIMQDDVRGFLPPRDQNVVTTSEFERIKLLLPKTQN